MIHVGLPHFAAGLLRKPSLPGQEWNVKSRGCTLNILKQLGNLPTAKETPFYLIIIFSPSRAILRLLQNTGNELKGMSSKPSSTEKI